MSVICVIHVHSYKYEIECYTILYSLWNCLNWLLITYPPKTVHSSKNIILMFIVIIFSIFMNMTCLILWTKGLSGSWNAFCTCNINFVNAIHVIRNIFINISTKWNVPKHFFLNEICILWYRQNLLYTKLGVL